MMMELLDPRILFAVYSVDTYSELQAAALGARSGDVVEAHALIAGTKQVAFRQGTSNVIVRGDATLKGFGLWFQNVDHPTVEGLTFQDPPEHAVTFNTGVKFPTARNLKVFNPGDQAIKVNPFGVDNGLIEGCTFKFTAGYVNDYYTAGVDIHNGDNWVIRNNTFEGFRRRRSTDPLTHEALLVWNDSRDCKIYDNIFKNNDRDIAVGKYAHSQDFPSLPDSQRAQITGNVITRDSATRGDVAIFVAGIDGYVARNKFTDASHAYGFAIEGRWDTTDRLVIEFNDVTGRIRFRDGATGTIRNNTIR